MAEFFSLTLAVSLVGLIILIALKSYELSTGRVFLGGLRPKIGNFFHRVLLIIERGVPGLAHVLTRRALHAGRVRVSGMFARAILFFEKHLENILHVVRQKSQAPRSGNGATSQFLQEVAAHKQKLLKRAPSRRMIFDDQ